MKDLLDKISSYNLFNYLFPGTLFVIAIEKISKFSLIQENLILGAFFYYFIGLVISRVGSIIIEPILKITSFIKFSDYKDFIDASKKDDKINLLSETNNMFRTLTTLFIILLFIEPFEKTYEKYPVITPYLIMIGLLLLFLFAYKKQTSYIKKRIECNKE